MAAIRLAWAGAAWSREFEEGDDREARDERETRDGRVDPRAGEASVVGSRAVGLINSVSAIDTVSTINPVSPVSAVGAEGAGLLRASRERVEALLRAKKLDGTLTGGEREDEAARAAWVARLAPTGWAEIDTRLGGGFPRGECSEIVGARSTGRTSVLCALLAGAAARGEIVALVDACDRFDPVSAAGFGFDLDRLLWVRGFSPEPAPGDTGTAHAGAAREEAERQARRLDRAVKAFGLILQAGGFGIVALDLADVPEVALRRLPFTTWRRLQRLLEGSDTVGLLLAAEPLGRSARGVTLRLAAAEGGRHLTWTGASDHARLFTGFAFQPQVHSTRRLGDEPRTVSTGATPELTGTSDRTGPTADLRHTGTRG